MTEQRSSVACEACFSGWWGMPDDRCPRCDGKVKVTQTIVVVPLRDVGGPEPS